MSNRIDALEGHLAQLLARQRQGLPASDASGRIVRTDLQFDDADDTDGFDERFTTFTDSTEIDEQSRNWLLG
ncbi:MAG: hypothetical protein HKO87_01230 [Acidimicrobiia bacterium]|nr:hypothetical protein [Acidimicrobiia bacterium]